MEAEVVGVEMGAGVDNMGGARGVDLVGTGAGSGDEIAEGVGSGDKVGAEAGRVDKVRAGVDIVEAVFVVIRPGTGRRSRPGQISPARLR